MTSTNRTADRRSIQRSSTVTAPTSAQPTDANAQAFAATPPSIFKLGLGDTASISASHEQGTIIARTEYLNSEPSYLLRYKANDGRAVEAWWQESALT